MNEFRGLWRGKRIANGEWALGCLVTNGQKTMLFGVDENANKIRSTDVDPLTVGECAGVRDKNGYPIFEGDVVEAYKFGAEKFVNVIAFRNGCFWYGDWNFIEFLDKFRDYQVIGNVYNKPAIFAKGGKQNGKV